MKKMFLGVLMMASITGESLASTEATTNKEYNTPAFETAVEKIVKDVISQNPKFVFDAIQEYMIQEESASIETLREQDQEQGIDSQIPLFGPIGSGPAVLFAYDYNCEPCVDAAIEVAQVAFHTQSIRLYLLDIARNEQAMEASRIALSAQKQGKDQYETMHLLLLDEQYGEDSNLEEMSASAGLDYEKLLEDSEQNSPSAVIQSSRNLLSKYDIERIPAVIVGDTVIYDDIEYDNLIRIIHEQWDAQDTDSN